jgi:putative FmdB family regulatory protein
MPLWDFKCEHCDTVMELMFPTYDASTHATCPTCHAPLVRQAAAGGFVVRGYNAKNLYSKKS